MRLFLLSYIFGRDDVTRTRDPYVPNVVRYQLRHFSKAGAKVLLFFEMCKFFAIILHFFCEK